MSIQRSLRQRRSYRAVALGSVIVVMIAGAIVATVDSYQAEREQRLTAARALRDYALFASYTYSQNAYLYARERMLTSYAPLAASGPLTRNELPPETVVLPPDEKCGAAERRQPYRFRLDLPSRVLHISRGGEGAAGLWEQLDQPGGVTPGGVTRPSAAAVSPALEDQLRDTLALLAISSPVRRFGWGYAFVPGDEGREAVSFRPAYDSSGAPIAIYGYESCYALTDQTDFATLYRDVQALPPSLVGSLPHDSLFFLQVRDREGRVLYSRGIRSPQTTYTGVTAMPQLAGISFSVTLRPSLAPGLPIGGMPLGGAPRALALLVLSVILGALALVLFRREARFVDERDAFVTDVSHELRTPLQQILIFVQLLRLGRLRSDDERARSLAIIETETQRLIGLVANILGRARPEPDQSRVRPVDIHPVLRNSIALFTPLAAGHRVTIELTGEDASAMADPEALHQVLTSLLDNAVKYGPPGQVVRVSTAVSAEWVTIHVDDEGPGIPLKERQKVWEPFVRLGSPAARASGGVGIGLAIVRAAVQRMSGTIVIEDAPRDGGGGGSGGGTRLTLCLPRSTNAATRSSNDPSTNNTNGNNSTNSFNLTHAIDSHR